MPKVRASDYFIASLTIIRYITATRTISVVHLSEFRS